MTLIATQGGYGTELVPARRRDWARIMPFRPAASLTIRAGQAMGVKTADQLLYAFVSGASDGTQLLAGFSKYSFRTDANSLAYLGDIGSAATPVLQPRQLVDVYTQGIFRPDDVSTSATLTANVVTYTPAGTITTGDVNIITYTRPNQTTKTITFTVAGTTTATAVANGLRAAWNADTEMAALATASGTATFILTSTNAGYDLAAVLASSVTGVGTLTEANTTPAAGRVFSQIVTARPGSRLEPDGLWMVY